MIKDLELAGYKFKMTRLDAIRQFHLAARIGPMLADLAPSLKNMPKDVSNLSTDDQLDMIAKFAGPILNGLSKLSDDDREKVLFGLLAKVEVNVGGVWVPMLVGERQMRIDLELPDMIKLAGQSFMMNLAGFFNARPSSS